MSCVKITFSLLSWTIVCLFQHVVLHLFGTQHQAVGILWLFKNILLLKVVVKLYGSI